MKQFYHNYCKYLVFFLTVFFCTTLHAQTAKSEDFSSYSAANPLFGRLVQLMPHLPPPAATKPLTFSFAGTPGVTTGAGIMYLGERPAGTTIFRASNIGLFFNYTTGGVIPGASSGTGEGDYRIHFANSTDTSAKLGNFKLLSMYLAIGTGTAPTTITIKGFRAGRVQVQSTIDNLESGVAMNKSDGTNVSYSETAGSNVNGNVTLTFGSGWTFLDGITITMPKDIPLHIDDLVFDQNGPDNIAPTFQDFSLTPLNVTGITASLAWSRTGSADYSAVFVKAATTGTVPVTTGSTYTANTIFGTGSEVAGSGWYCVYNGQASSVNITNGLSPGTAYRAMVVGYNGSGGFEVYKTNVTTNIADFTTIATPTAQAANLSFTNVGATSATLSWTNGTGTARAVFAALTNTATVTPTFNTAYIANTTLASGGQISTTGWRCVFNGTGNSVTISGLSAGQTYMTRVFEYNDNGSGGGQTFLTATASNNPLSVTTDNVPVVTTSAASLVTTTTATLNGIIDDKGSSTGVRFQYATNSGLVPATTITGSPVTITGDTGPTAITGTLTGLDPSTVYFYRARGINSVGTVDGAILSLTTSPVVNSVTATNTNGSYKAGELIVINIVFSSAVTVTGTPELILNSGGTAFYASGSGTTTLTFNYTISAGNAHGDLDYASTTSLGLAGGTIKDASNNNALLTLPTVGGASSLGGQKNIVIDTQTPTLSGVTIASNNTTTTLAKVGNIVTLNFTSSEAIAIPTVTIAGHAISATNTSGNNWKIDYTMVSGDATGVVTFSIPFSDLVGNAGTTISATTNSSSVVFDKTVPVLTPVTIGSNNTNTALAKTGNLVTLDFTASETINSPTVTIAGHAVTAINTSANNWQAVYVMASGDVDGVISINISFSDPAGNNGTAVTATTNSSSVTFDKTVPSLSSVSIASNNTNTSLVKTGETVTLNFTSGETIATPTVTIAGHTVTATNGSGNNWTAVYTMIAGDATGTVSFNIEFSDLTGNAGTAVSATTNTSSVVYDKTVPFLSSVSIASNHTNTAYAKVGHVITLSFTSSETIFTPTVTIHGHAVTANNAGGNNWTATYTMVSGDVAGTVSFNIAYTDITGNNGTAVTATTNSSNVLFDKTAPILSPVTFASNNTNTSLARTGDALTLSFTATETITTPVVTIAGNSVTATSIGSNNWVAFYTMVSGDASGVVAFNIAFNDLAGNAGTTVTATTNSSSVTYDKTRPVISFLSIASNNSDPTKAKVGDVVTINFTASEPVNTPSVMIASHAATTITNTGGDNWRATYTMTSADVDGTVTMVVSVSDLASNISSALFATTDNSRVTFDRTAPQLSLVRILTNNSSGLGTVAKTGDQVVLVINSSEFLNLPVVTIAGHTITLPNNNGSSWSVPYIMAAGDAEGIIPFNITFSDVSGNTGTAVTATTDNTSVRYDKTTPLLSSVTIASNNAISNRAKIGDVVTVTFTANETLRTPTVRIYGRTATVTNTTGNTWTGSYTMTSADGNGTITFSIDFLDVAGNAGVSATTTTNNSSVVFDKLGPILQTVTIASNNGSFPTRAKAGNVVTVSFTATEAILTPTATIAGKPATVVNTSGNNWTASYTLVAADPEGSVAFNIVCTDLLGNVGAAVTTTTNSGIVTHDKTAPLLTTVTITSVGESSPSRARVGSVVLITVLANETIHIPVVTIAGLTATSPSPVVGTSWNFSVTLTAAVNEGVLPFNISFGDIAGIPGVTVTTTTNNSSVILDKTNPVLTNVTIASNNADPSRAKIGDLVTVSYVASEPISPSVNSLAGFGFAATNTGGNSWKVSYTMRSTDAEGVIPFTIRFNDVYGNNGTNVSATTNNSSVVFDKTNPSLTDVTISSNNANPLLAKPGDIVTLKFTSSESIAIPSATIAGQTAAINTTGNNNWTATYTMTGNDTEGTVAFSIMFTDLAGNAGTITTTTNSGSVAFDKADPSITSIVRQLPTASAVNATTVTYRVTFSEPVSGVTTSSFLLTTSGATTGTIASVSTVSGTVVDVTVNGISGNGTLRLDLKSTGTGITDAVGKTNTGGFISGESYTINQSILSFPAGGTQSLALCVGASTPTSLTNMLRVKGADNGKLLTWTIVSGPSHGTLNGFAATATVSGTETAPPGVSYLATSGYTGTDAFTIQVSDGIVSETASVNVTVNALPVVTITPSQGTILCGTGATLSINASGGNTYNWYNNGTLIPNTTGAQLTVGTSGTYTAKGIDAVGCTGVIGNAIVITQLQKPTVAFTYTTYCIGKPISFIDQSVTANSGQVSYLWNDGNNTTSTNASPVFTFNQQSAYTVKLKITPTACPLLADSITRLVTIDVPTAAIRMPSINAAVNNQISLQARTFGTAYQWLPTAGISSPNSAATILTVSKEQQYTVAISGASGCVTVDTVLVKIFVENTFLVPNIFTPNNDGQNDKLFVNLVGIKTLQFFRIVNRYGKKMFETNNLAEGWDGKLNGVPQPVDTYIWTASGLSIDGAPIRREGTITLVR